MSSNDLEAMSHAHATAGELAVDVSSDAQLNSPSLKEQLSPPRDSAQEAKVLTNGEVAKSVQVSAAKRRKVISETASSGAVPRQTRFGAIKPPAINSNKQKTSKVQTLEGIKNATRAAHKKQLQETYEVHDVKVRELFHLTKFVSLVDYDAKAAKHDESEVFKEVLCILWQANLCSSNSLMTYGRRLQMQRQVDGFVQPDMLLALKRTLSVLPLQLLLSLNRSQLQTHSGGRNDHQVSISPLLSCPNVVDVLRPSPLPTARA
jgi:hypothetical protein